MRFGLDLVVNIKIVRQSWQMSTKTLQFIAKLTKSIQFAEKANTSLKPDIFSFTNLFSL
jgi:hypothetical protein